VVIIEHPTEALCQGATDSCVSTGGIFPRHTQNEIDDRLHDAGRLGPHRGCSSTLMPPVVGATIAASGVRVPVLVNGYRIYNFKALSGRNRWFRSTTEIEKVRYFP
jgi:hypothetical protein